MVSGVIGPKRKSDCASKPFADPIAHQIKSRPAASFPTTGIRMVIGGPGPTVRLLGLDSGSTPYQVVIQAKLLILPGLFVSVKWGC